MSEVVTEPVTEPTPDATSELGENGVKALNAEREARKAAEKAANDLAAKVKQFEDRDKSESDKLQEQLQELTSRAAKAERENARLAAIAKHQIPADYHDLIQGDDEAALEASAAKVQTLLAVSAPPTDRASYVIPDEGGHPRLALNGDGIESALKNALGIPG